MKYFIYCFKHYADFNGRARRKEYWFYTLFYIIIFWVLFMGWLIPMIISIANMPDEADMDEILLPMLKNPCLYLFFIFYIASLIPTLAVTVRRLHDIGRPGWWLLGYYGVSALVQIIPEVSYRLTILAGVLILPISIIFLVWMFTDSQYGPNQYGPNPKGEGNPPEDGATPEQEATIESNMTIENTQTTEDTVATDDSFNSLNS